MKRIVAVLLFFTLCLTLCACGKADDYERAIALMDEGNYEEAITVFTELGDYEDSTIKLEECKNSLDYNKAVVLLAEEKFGEALTIFLSLGDYRDSVSKAKECENAIAYNKAVSLIADGQYIEARTIFETIPEYKDVAEYLARYIRIDITEENWEEYFDVVPQPNWQENAFGEGDLWGGIDYCLTISETYAPVLLSADVAMAFTTGWQRFIIEIDAPNFTYEITENLSSKTNYQDCTIRFTKDTPIEELCIDHCEVYPNQDPEYWYIYNTVEISLTRSLGAIEIYSID